MGSEHSSHPAASSGNRANPLQRGKSVPERETSSSESVRQGSISPGPSICSDSDLPYISYTVNRPIGDSPKLPHKHGTHIQRGKSLGSTRVLPKRLNNKVAHSIVVVKPAATAESTDKDPDLLRLQVLSYWKRIGDISDKLFPQQSVPMFLPIMRGTLNLPAVRDPEVLERLDPGGLLSLCLRYQQHLAVCSELVAPEQLQLGNKVRDVDCEISRLMALMTERQKKYAKYAEKLGKVHELSHQLNRCHMVLNQTLESMETLNNALPLEERLEPFVWTTG